VVEISFQGPGQQSRGLAESGQGFDWSQLLFLERFGQGRLPTEGAKERHQQVAQKETVGKAVVYCAHSGVVSAQQGKRIAGGAALSTFRVHWCTCPLASLPFACQLVH